MTTNLKQILVVYHINLTEIWNIGVPTWLSVKESGSCSRKRVSNVIRQVMYEECVALRPSGVLNCYVDAN